MNEAQFNSLMLGVTVIQIQLLCLIVVVGFI
jgi:hypothetical protein